jgi:hypothetical protein
LSSSELAIALKLTASKRNTVDVALRKFTETKPYCREPVQNPRRGEPRVTYRVDPVWNHLLSKLPKWRPSATTN